MLGNWKADLPNGTYTVILRNDIGEEQTEQLVVGDGVTSQASDIIVSDSSGATVYVGRTDETGNYSIYTDDWPSGYYTFKFTNVFGKTTTETMYISQSHSDTQSSVIH